MRPIPKKLLIHQVTHVTAEGTDIWQETNDSIKTELSYIRVDPSSNVVLSKDNTEIQLSATLIYDCRNSRPSNMNFSPEQVIVFQGNKHKIITVEYLYDGKKLHHLELGLM